MLGKNLIQAAAGAAGGEVLGVEDVFSTYLYTGNGSTQTITNGIDLAGEGGLVWVKNRGSNQSHSLYDTARGVGKFILTNTTLAQGTSNGVSAFNSDGFSVGPDYLVSASDTYASWTFRKAEKFFDVVTYTGDGTAGRTISHNLGSVPGCIIVKRLNVALDWVVYHRITAATKYLRLNLTNSAATSGAEWNNTEPTDSVFTVGTSGYTNNTGDTYVAYLFAHDAGGFGDDGSESVIKCGSYTGNGGLVDVNLGWEAQWVLVKRTDSTSDWRLIDSMRGLTVYDQNSRSLQPNHAFSEGQANTYPGASATGFVVGNPAFESEFAVNGATYIYIAIRRGPMKTPKSGTEVFNTAIPSGVTSTGFTVDLLFGGIRAGNFTSPFFYTRLLGGTKYLLSSSTAAEATSTDIGFDTNDGLKLSFGGGYINYYLRRAPGFFDVVAYDRVITSTYADIQHNLGVQPELIIVKARNATYDWAVWSTALAEFGYLNYTSAFTVDSQSQYSNLFYNTSPTATSFRVGTATTTNYQGGVAATYIAYLFATLPGISKCGSYTGTGTTLNVDCGFTAGARFVMIKRTDSTGDWYVWDTARGIVSGNDSYLLLNSTAAEVTNTDYIDPLSSGFQISSTAPAAINASGGSFIFLAVA